MDKQTGSFFKDAPLVCPNCGDEYLRHQSIEVYCRDGLDAETGLKTEVSNAGVTVTRNMGGNPSKRSDGITITFECETCDHKSMMSVEQREGKTFFSMK